MGERLEENAANDTEDRGVGANAERQCEHDDGGEGRAVPERANRESHVGRELLEPTRPALIARLFLVVFDATELAERCRPRSAQRHAASDVRSSLALDVVAH